MWKYCAKRGCWKLSLIAILVYAFPSFGPSENDGEARTSVGCVLPIVDKGSLARAFASSENFSDTLRVWNKNKNTFFSPDGRYQISPVFKGPVDQFKGVASRYWTGEIALRERGENTSPIATVGTVSPAFRFDRLMAYQVKAQRRMLFISSYAGYSIMMYQADENGLSHTSPSKDPHDAAIVVPLFDRVALLKNADGSADLVILYLGKRTGQGRFRPSPTLMLRDALTFQQKDDPIPHLSESSSKEVGRATFLSPFLRDDKHLAVVTTPGSFMGSRTELYTDYTLKTHPGPLFGDRLFSKMAEPTGHPGISLWELDLQMPYEPVDFFALNNDGQSYGYAVLIKRHFNAANLVCLTNLDGVVTHVETLPPGHWFKALNVGEDIQFEIVSKYDKDFTQVRVAPLPSQVHWRRLRRLIQRVRGRTSGHSSRALSN